MWQEVVRSTLLDLGFDVNVKSPNLHYHKERNVKIATHVDDFLMTGRRVDVAWVKHTSEKEFALKCDMLGPSRDEEREATLLGRTIRWKDGGLEYEGDTKHAKLLAKSLELEESKAIDTLGIADEERIEAEGE